MNPFTLVLTYFVKFFVKEIHKGKVCVWESHYVRSLHTLIVQSILKNILLQRNVVLLKDISLMPQNLNLKSVYFQWLFSDNVYFYWGLFASNFQHYLNNATTFWNKLFKVYFIYLYMIKSKKKGWFFYVYIFVYFYMKLQKKK